MTTARGVRSDQPLLSHHNTSTMAIVTDQSTDFANLAARVTVLEAKARIIWASSFELCKSRLLKGAFRELIWCQKLGHPQHLGSSNLKLLDDLYVKAQKKWTITDPYEEVI